MDKILTIMRGVPGSGKTFEVDKILDELNLPREGHVFCVDDYLESHPEGYIAFRLKAKEGGYLGPMMYKFHKQNEEKVANAMSQGVTPIIVDNTNLDIKTMKPYIEAALVYGYKVEFREPSSDHWQTITKLLENKPANGERLKFAALKLASKNRHGVPYEAIYKMFQKWKANVVIEDFRF